MYSYFHPAGVSMEYRDLSEDEDEDEEGLTSLPQDRYL